MKALAGGGGAAPAKSKPKADQRPQRGMKPNMADPLYGWALDADKKLALHAARSCRVLCATAQRVGFVR
jgi:hypothetical protein